MCIRHGSFLSVTGLLLVRHQFLWVLSLFSGCTCTHTSPPRCPAFPHLAADISFQPCRITLRVTGVTSAQTECELCQRTRPRFNIFSNSPFLGQRKKAETEKRTECYVCLSSQRPSRNLLSGRQTWLPSAWFIHAFALSFDKYLQRIRHFVGSWQAAASACKDLTMSQEKCTCKYVNVAGHRLFKTPIIFFHLHSFSVRWERECVASAIFGNVVYLWPWRVWALNQGYSNQLAH